uniref:Uncharacterized protein n=1 Tax=Oryza meridionalis TaxID=40149 RepID=A0A0E0DHT1_9ORYZ
MPKPTTVPNGRTLLWLRQQCTATSSRITYKKLVLYRLLNVPQALCSHYKNVTVYDLNPKIRVGSSTASDGYLKGGFRKFIVTDDLNIIPFPMASTLQVIRAAKIPNEMLLKKELTLDKSQVFHMLLGSEATEGRIGDSQRTPKK